MEVELKPDYARLRRVQHSFLFAHGVIDSLLSPQDTTPRAKFQSRIFEAPPKDSRAEEHLCSLFLVVGVSDVD